MTELRPHQQDAIDAVTREFHTGTRRTAIVHPTGLGKGHIIASLAVDEVARGGRVLVLAHREEILAQLAERVALFDSDIRVGHVQGGRNEHRHPITTAMIQTLGRGGRRLEQMARPALVIVDECHRSASKGYRDVLDWAGCFDPDGARLVGLTATFTRGDEQGLGDIFTSVAHRVELAWSIEHGWLVKPRGLAVVADHMSLDGARVRQGDYVECETGQMVTQDAEQIAAAWHQHAEGRLTVAFVPDVESAHHLADAFLRTGVAAEVVTGATSRTDRAAIYRRLRRGSTRVLVNVFVLVEGWDEPRVECILWARPTRLPGVYMEGVGRGLRPHPGKSDCLVLDVVGASRTQKLQTLVDLVPTAEYDSNELDEAQQADGPRKSDSCRRHLEGPAEYEEVDLLARPLERRVVIDIDEAAFRPRPRRRVVIDLPA
jgi:superfamily II DNA or RNA helicase